MCSLPPPFPPPLADLGGGFRLYCCLYPDQADHHRLFRKQLKNHCKKCSVSIIRGSHVPESHASSPSLSQDSDDDSKPLPEPESRSIPTPASLDETTDGSTPLDPSWPCLRMSHLPGDNLAFLRQKGVFKVPEKGLLVPLLTSYCNWIHPQLPFLDLSSILDGIFNHDGPKISPLLFQSIIYAGAAHVPDTTFQRFGYASRAEAQNVFFQRAKVCVLIIYRDAMYLSHYSNSY